MSDDRQDRKAQDEGTKGKSKPNEPTPQPKPGDRKRAVKPKRYPRGNYSEMPSRSGSEPEKVAGNTPTATQPMYGFSQGVLSMVEAVSGEQPTTRYEEVKVPIAISGLFDYLVDSIYRYVRTRSMSPDPLISREDLSLTLRYILLARIGQVSGLRLPQRPAEIRYPAIFGPILAAVGRFIHPTAAYEIIPTIDPSNLVWKGLVDNVRVNAETKDVTFTIVKPKELDAVLSTLLALGSPENIGLPADTITDTDEIYRLDQTENGFLTGSGDFTPDSAAILVRAFLNLGTLARLYGQHRVAYAAIGAMYSAVDKLARDSFTMGVGANTR